MSRSLWSSVSVAMQSALASALTITAITKANPGVVTYTGTDPTNADYVLLLVQGMYQLNNRVVRIANVNAAGNTFELEGIDTTNFDTFASGTAQVITFGTTFATLTDVNASGGEPTEEDATTIHDNIDQVEFGNFTPLIYSFGSQWDPTDTANAALFAASQIKASRAFRFSFANGRKFLIYGAVAFSGAPTGQAKRIVTSPVKITARGFPTFYSA
jgi:hypothetical protein